MPPTVEQLSITKPPDKNKMSLPVAVETLKERFLTNVKVIERLADEKRSLEDYV